MLRDHALEAMFPYQREGVDWMRSHGAFLLADERGLGKSLQILVDFDQNIRKYNPTARMLLVAPNNVILKWAEKEVPKWSTFSVEVATGKAKQRSAAIAAGSDITVIAYDNIARELAHLNDQGYYSLVFDEAHNIKSYKALRTKAAFALRGARREMVTGSPFLNRADELWPLLFMVAPREFPNYWTFVNHFCVFGGYENRQIVGVQNVRELRKRLAPFMLRRTIADVGQQLPPLQIVPVEVDLSPEQRKVYEQARTELKITIEGTVLHEFSNPLTKFARLRATCNTLAAVGGPDVSTKLDRVVELVREIGSDHKIVLFSGDIATLRCMQARLAVVGITAPVVSGKDDEGHRTDARKRQPIIDAFQEGIEPRVLLASHGVAREGIDLYAAHYAIVLDKMWNQELQDQEYGRLHRTGQTADRVIIYEMFAKNTVESRVEKILATKRHTFEQVIGEDSLIQASLNAYAEELLAA